LDLFVEAMCSYEKALALCPSNPRYVYNVGLALFDRNEFQRAKEYLQRCLAIDPNIPEAQNNLCACLLKLHDPLVALGLADRAIALKPDYAEAWSNRGNALGELRRHEEALASYDRSIELKPDYAEAWSNRGNALGELRRHEEALASYDRSIELKPDYAEAWSNRGNALNDLRRHEEALASYDRSIELKPDYAEAWSNRGNALNDLRRHEDALASHERALELKPDYAEAWSNRGVALNALRRHEEALASYDRSIELKPDYPDALYNKGLLQLAQKDFTAGFENYLRRWDSKNFTSRTLKTGLPLCNPTIEGRNLLLWAEQGIGDEIFYAGMLTQALEKFPNISLVADARLHPLFRRSFPMVTLLEKDQPLTPEFLKKTDLQAPIGDLGHILGLGFDAIMSTRRPFLVADRAKSSMFESLAPFSSGKITCGLAWRSHNKNFGEEKSIDLEQLEPILRNAHLEFINLQYGEVDSEIQKVRSRFGVNVHQVEGVDIYKDIDGLLALIDACDIVVTTSNVTAHLAGSIGKRGCVFVPSSKGKIWYWHLDDTNNFWYPSLKVCYQDGRYDWTDTILQAKTWIERDVSWR
jgi:tetratricopeptide (TPR) repeat protein